MESKSEQVVTYNNKKEFPRQEGIPEEHYQYHHKDPLSSSVIYLDVDLSSWACVAVAYLPPLLLMSPVTVDI